MSRKLKIGFVGNCMLDECFEDKVRALIINSYMNILEQYKGYDEYVLISGATNIGSVKIAYEEAEKLGWTIKGIACELEKKYETFPDLKDEDVIIVGKTWGDESYLFEHSVDVLVRVGGGEQSLKETEHIKKLGIKVFEYDY